MQVFDTSPRLSVYKGVGGGVAFSDTKQLLIGCREQLKKKDTEFDSKVSHLMKNMKSKKLLMF